MSLLLSLIIGMVVLVFAGLAFAPLLLSPDSRPETGQPALRVIKGGKADTFEDAA